MTTQSELGRGPISLLVVEDEAIVARDLEVTLRGLGYQVVGTVAEGRLAIAAAEQLRPDLVLMDIRLRGAMDGIEAATEIWRRLGIAVIFLSAYADEDTLARARAALPFGYLVKPFLGQQLRPAIEVAVHKERADRELRQSDRRLRNALEALDAAVVIADAGGLIRWTNPRARELCGGADGLLGRHLAELFPEDGSTAKASATGRTTLRPGQATLVTVEFCRAPLDDSEGSTLVTFRESAKEVSGPALRTDREAREALARLASGLADHTRAPLLALSSTLQLVEAERTPGSFGDHDTVPLLRRQVERIRDLVNYVVQFGHNGLDLESAALADLVKDAVARVGRLSNQRGVSIVAMGEEGWPKIMADRDRLGAALGALLENAVQHSHGGSEVVLRARTDGVRSVRLSVEDRGPGFDPVDMPRVFEPFFSRRSGGTGMGLALAQRIAELHGGSVEVANREGGGARVVLELPLLTEAG